MEFTKSRLELIKKYEGLRLTTYDDATGKPVEKLADVTGTLCIGYGNCNDVSLSIVFPAGYTISEAKADEWLGRVVDAKAKTVTEILAKIPITLNQNQFDALVMLIYNVGEICLTPKRSIHKKLVAGDIESIPQAMMQWCKINMRASKQLQKRRQEEVDIFNMPV